MREIENRIEKASRGSGDELNAADSERDARTLTSLARLFEKLTDLDGAESGSLNNAKREVESLADKEIDAERFRRDIADRVAFSPITFSAKGDTLETIAQARRHNAAWDAICEERK